jgi:RNA polymerase sigma-70 factor (ECF subfamily)
MDHLSLPEALVENPDRAFEQLVRDYQDRMYRFGLRLTGSPQDAEEIAQEAFVRAYSALAGYDPERIRSLTLRPWLYRIALNVFRNRVRRRQLHMVPLDGDLGTADDGRPEEAAEQAERRAHLAALVAGLPQPHRVAVVLRHVEGLSYPEMAAVLQQPIGTVKANVHRGIRALRVALADERREVPA